ncbi:type I pullulanase [Metabacillus malikii]|uniref:Pullulanase n=1 Tax=Metabacillus malikii TaxID=1504265 RepID=A0ABT9ZHE5_9BACI|nr:type I pullulanase [Metabacillus malikii]MDQ0231231.1 pullulanase [Metabacillus malikii]
MLKINREYEAYLDHINEIVILLPIELEREEKAFYIRDINGKRQLDIQDKMNIGSHIKYICHADCSDAFGRLCSIVDENGLETDLQIGAVIRTKQFDEMFKYEGSDLGVTYSKVSSSFKVWAPTATSVKLRIYNKQKQEYSTTLMERVQSGVWSLTLDGDFDGYLYTYLACVNLLWKEAVDPYAKAVTINGEYGVIFDEESCKITKETIPPFPNKNDAIIYEAHIRDFSIHDNSGMSHKGKYKAWLDIDTENNKGDSTGVSYLKELGITHVELLPINDYEEVDETEPNRQYNWGYNPLHFFAPEGSYSLNPANPLERIKEVKQLIQALHQQQLRVILDVVYNHVYAKEDSPFEKLVPGYYFRYDENGIASNGTGVGNDLAPERYMVRKLIVDCATYWMKEYDVDGFRFDLMGILDVDTMNEVQHKLLEIKPDAFLLGEGWDLNTPLPFERKAIIANANKTPMISFFNDESRDVIKGSTFSIHDTGFVYGNLNVNEHMKQIVSGSPHKFNRPSQSINYVEAHDNHTMWDRFLLYAPNEGDDVRKARHRLATSIILLSQGVPFLHAGQEFFRTKNGVENSYNAPDEINRLNWTARSEYKENVDYIKGLIKLRKMHRAFRLDTTQLINEHLTFPNLHEQLLAYQLENVEKFGPWSSIIVVHNNRLNNHLTITLPEGNWLQIVTPDTVQLDNNEAIMKNQEIEKIGTYVFCKN